MILDMDISRAMDMIQKRKEYQRQYYIRKQGIADTDMETKIAEQARKQMIAYEKQKERQKHQRAERGLKRKGRPFKTPELKLKVESQMQQLNLIQFSNVD